MQWVEESGYYMSIPGLFGHGFIGPAFPYEGSVAPSWARYEAHHVSDGTFVFLDWYRTLAEAKRACEDRCLGGDS